MTRARRMRLAAGLALGLVCGAAQSAEPRAALDRGAMQAMLAPLASAAGRHAAEISRAITARAPVRARCYASLAPRQLAARGHGSAAQLVRPHEQEI